MKSSNQETEPSLRFRRMPPWLALTLQVLAIILIDALLVRRLDPAAGSMSFALFWRNCLPLILCNLLLYGLFGRYLLAIWVTGVLTWVLFTVNAIKLANMNLPLMPSDMVLEHQLLGSARFFSHYTRGGLSIALGVMGFLVVVAALWWVARRWRRAWLAHTHGGSGVVTRSAVHDSAR